MFSRVVTVCFCAVLATAAFGIWRVLDVSVSTFVVNGDLTQAQQSRIIEVLSQQSFDGVLSTPLEDVASAVETLSWTRQVSVRRAWPQGFEITLYHEKPVARWGEDEYISASGQTLVLPDNYMGLPRFSVAVATPQRAMEIYRMLDQVAARAGLSISQLRQDAYAEWAVDFEDGATVLLGGEQLNERMHRFLLVQRRVLAESSAPAHYIDARYSSGVAVRFDEPSERGSEEGREEGSEAGSEQRGEQTSTQQQEQAEGVSDPLLAQIGVDTTGERP